MPAKIIQRKHTKMKKVKVDSVTIDIIESALRNARFEMDTVLFRTAMSPGIREQHDEFPMICNERGQIVQPEAIVQAERARLPPDVPVVAVALEDATPRLTLALIRGAGVDRQRGEHALEAVHAVRGGECASV